MTFNSYDPSQHTVNEVMEYVGSHPDEARQILEAEQQGQNRSTLTNQLSANVNDPTLKDNPSNTGDPLGTDPLGGTPDVGSEPDEPKEGEPGHTVPTSPKTTPEQLPSEGDEDTETEVGDYVDYGTERYEVTAIDEETGALTIKLPSEEGDGPEQTVSPDEVNSASKYQREDGKVIDLTDGSDEYRQQLAEDGVI